MENKNVKELFYPMHLNIQYSKGHCLHWRFTGFALLSFS